MKLSIFLAFLVVNGIAQADCPSTLPLKGFSTVKNCYPANINCVAADEVLHEYVVALKDEDPETLIIILHGSPWHVYGPDYHILEIEELAGTVRQRAGKIKRVTLLSSWSGIAPDGNSKSLAQKLSIALDGMPVAGTDGFVWFTKDGTVETTQQAFTAVKGGPYWVAAGDHVMASLVAGWTVGLEAEFTKRRDAAGLIRAGVGSDVFMLCPERALSAFDAGAALSDPIAAYNAAIMRLERGARGDAQAAIGLFKKSATLGNKKAQSKLKSLSTTAPPGQRI